MFITPNFQNGQSIKIYLLTSRISFQTTASSTTAIPCVIYSIVLSIPLTQEQLYLSMPSSKREALSKVSTKETGIPFSKNFFKIVCEIFKKKNFA
jgi:hypothetical protein